MIDKKTIKNKSIIDTFSKDNDTLDDTITKFITVNFKNSTLLDGVVYPAGIAKITKEQYERVKKFL